MSETHNELMLKYEFTVKHRLGLGDRRKRAHEDDILYLMILVNSLERVGAKNKKQP